MLKRPGGGAIPVLPMPPGYKPTPIGVPRIKPKLKKRPGAGEKAYPMPGITRSTGGGIVGTTGRNVNPVYNTY